MNEGIHRVLNLQNDSVNLLGPNTWNDFEEIMKVLATILTHYNTFLLIFMYLFSY